MEQRRMSDWCPTAAHGNNQPTSCTGQGKRLACTYQTSRRHNEQIVANPSSKHSRIVSFVHPDYDPHTLLAGTDCLVYSLLNIRGRQEILGENLVCCAYHCLERLLSFICMHALSQALWHVFDDWFVREDVVCIVLGGMLDFCFRLYQAVPQNIIICCFTLTIFFKFQCTTHSPAGAHLHAHKSCQHGRF